MRTKIIIIGVVILAVLVLVAIIILPRLNKPEQALAPTYWPTNGWQTNTPEQQGLDSDKLADALQFIKDQDLKINSLMIIRNGYVLLDTTFYNPYDGKYPHDMASVTKSVTTTLIGIAIAQGKLDMDQKVLSFFPELNVANMDSRKESLTVRHLVSMTNGFESGCLADDLGTLARMREASTDWVQGALNRKMVETPGKTFCYDSPGMHLLSAILQKATGMTELEFANQFLFAPLGIKEAYWETDLQGRNNGWGDLHLYPQDAAKIGYLFLNNGAWDGVQVVPADWVKRATTPLTDAGGDHYGYGWWITENSYGANGRGGQHVFVVPSLNAVVVTTGGEFEYDLIDPYISASVVDPANQLPANPQGVSRLQALVDSFVQPLPPLPSNPVPETAQAVSGKTYKVEPNLVGITSMRVDFDNPEVATVYLAQEVGDIVLRVGLDGRYRLSSEGSQLRGYWKDPQTFMIDKFDIGTSTIQLRFQGDRIEVETTGINLVGEMQDQ